MSETDAVAAPLAKSSAMTSPARSIAKVRGRSPPSDGTSCSGRRMSSGWPSVFSNRQGPQLLLRRHFDHRPCNGASAAGTSGQDSGLRRAARVVFRLSFPNPRAKRTKRSFLACGVEPSQERCNTARRRQYPTGGGMNRQYPSSINPAMCRQVRSSYRRPMIWMPTGSPFASPIGATVEGR